MSTRAQRPPIQRLRTNLPKRSIATARAIVQATPPRLLARGMNSPLGGLLTGAILGQMPNQISRKHAAALELVIRWRIVSPSGNADVYDVVIDHGDCRVVHGGQHIPPRVTLSTDRPTFLRLAVGAQDPMAAYFAGDLKFDGDVTAAMRMQMLFPTP